MSHQCQSDMATYPHRDTRWQVLQQLQIGLPSLPLQTTALPHATLMQGLLSFVVVLLSMIDPTCPAYASTTYQFCTSIAKL